MRIIILTQWFDPEPMPRGLAFAKALRESGHEIEVITGFPNYPGGKVYEGYKIQLRKQEVVDGINITRVALYPSHNNSVIKRILNYLSFAVSSCIYGLFSAKKADVIYVYHPPLTTAFSAMIISLFRRTPFVLDIQDMWPDTLAATGMVTNNILLKLIDKFSRVIYRQAKQITVITPGFRRLLIERKVAADKISIIYNWCDELALSYKESDVKVRELNTHFTIVFAGTMGKAQALETILIAAKQVQKINSNIQFVFIGGGIEVDKLKQYKQIHKIDNATFLPRMLMNEVGSILKMADILLVHLKNEPLFKITIPSKTQAYFAMGKPVLMAVNGDAADLVVQANAGFCVTPEDTDAIAKKILEIASFPPDFLTKLGDNAQKFYIEHLSIKKGVKAFCDVFNKMLQ